VTLKSTEITSSMSIIDWFAKREKNTVDTTEKLNIPGNLWVKCDQCQEILFQKDLQGNAHVCLKCSFHFRMAAMDRVALIFDPGSFVPYDEDLAPTDFLSFYDTESYESRIRKAQAKTKRKDAVVSGMATLKTQPVSMAVMDFSYMGGSMGSVVGEKITRAIERGLEKRCPVIVFTASGGARMQEGIMSLMQMGKTSGALERLGRAGIPYISVLCDPTTGGTSASFAILGDFNLAEPGALISFAGPRVIEQIIRQKLPDGFQRAEFLLSHGMVDRVVDRRELRDTLATLLDLSFGGAAL
jgi:acetyl-CoA carboxylase carboxyl transferase subunit beta